MVWNTQLHGQSTTASLELNRDKIVLGDMSMTKEKWVTIFEFSGSGLAMVYALLIASNTGNEILGFSLLLISALLFSAWGYIDKRWAFFALQFFYAASAIIGIFRWWS